MSPAVQAASTAAWRDETHVVENRRLYAEKFRTTLDLFDPPLAAAMPEAGFYYWMPTPIADTQFARELHRSANVQVLPGSFLARPAHGVNPGAGYVRIAVVAPLGECVEAIGRINEFSRRL